MPLPVCVATVRSATEPEVHRGVPLAELVRSSTCGVLRKNKGKEQNYLHNSYYIGEIPF